MIKGSLTKYKTPKIVKMCSRCHNFKVLYNLVGKCKIGYYDYVYYGHHMICSDYNPRFYIPPIITIQFELPL